MFLDKLNSAPQLVTFSDMMLLPGKTEIDPENISLKSRVTKNIELNLPFVSSPMDTVTGADMAIALARVGGVGVLHRNCPVEEELKMAKKVKRAESFIIRDVITIKPTISIGQAKEVMGEHSISGLPVVNENDEVIGILTKRDVRFASNEVNVEEMMSRKLVSAHPNLTLDDAKKLLHRERIEKLVIVNDTNKLEGLVTVKDLERRGRYPNSTRDKDGKLVLGAAIGPFDIKRAKALDEFVDFFVIDLAHGHNMNAMKSAAKISKEINSELVYGNFGSQEAVEDVVSIIEDVAAIRVGIGSGAICSTSVVTKASAPTLYSTILTANAVNELKIDLPVISDGGVRGSGEAALCFAGGASAIMMGSIFAGCRESPGQLLAIEGKMMKSYRGMGSRGAKQVRYALDRYSKPAKGIPEGVEGFVPFRGTVEDVVGEFTSGLKAAFGYAGAGNVSEMWNNSKLGKISYSGSLEAKPHDIYPASSLSTYPYKQSDY